MEHPYKDTDTPAGPFLYIAGRPYLPPEPVRPMLPEALTEEKGDLLAALVGQRLDIRIDESPRVILDGVMTAERYRPLTVVPVTMSDFAKIPYDGSGFGPEFEVFDWVYRLHLSADRDADIAPLLSRKDPYIRSEQAFKRATTHWGAERWSCLTIDIPHERGRFRTDVDIFAPQESPIEKITDIVIGLYSHREDLLRRLRGQ
ncbi:MAG: hypothetical protein ABIH41_07155 [Nanoarchaeota archaeon]